MVVSGSVSILILSIWALVNFGTGGIQAEKDLKRAHTEPTPLQVINQGTRESLGSVNQSVKQIQNDLNNYVQPY